MKFLPSLCAVALLSAGTATSAATVVIDSFDNTVFQFVGAPSLGPSPSNPSTTIGPTTDAIGGFRRITNTRTNPAGTGGASLGNQVETIVTDGSAFVSLADGLDGFSVFGWNAGGVDLTDGGLNSRITLSVLSADPLVLFGLAIGGQSVSSTVNGTGSLFFNFADFAGVDFTNVNSIDLTVSGPTGFSVNFDQVEAVAAAVIPLPASAWLLLAGVGGIGIAARRRA